MMLKYGAVLLKNLYQFGKHCLITEEDMHKNASDNSLKRKAVRDISKKPQKMIRREIENTPLFGNTVTYKQMRDIRQNRSRRQVLPPLPKDINDVHDVMDAVEVMKKTPSINTLFQNLLQEIKQHNEVKSVSDKFSDIRTNYDRVNFVYRLLENYKILSEIVPDKKCDKLAGKLREEGNNKFKTKNLKAAIELYTESLANAETGSENFSKALANRSAALFELELYEDCLKDISTALEYNYPEELQPKLLNRKEKALHLKSTHNTSYYFEPLPTIPDVLRSTSIQCASNAVKIQNSETQGRHIVATRNITIGEILVVEKPFSDVLLTDHFNHCHNCLKLCYNLIPCDSCTQVLYCKEKCRQSAFKYHKYECNVLKTLRKLQLDALTILPLKITIIVKDMYLEIWNNHKKHQNDDEIYNSDRYKEIHNLIGNTESRSIADLFERSCIAAIIFDVFKKYTNFFNSSEDETIFKELLMHHIQVGPCNFHEISEMNKTTDGNFETKEIGAGAYSFLSLFNHSCNPNVVRHCYGNTVVLRAIRTIQAEEQCFDNYGYHFAVMPKLERVTNLKKQYYFDCQCKACENDWPLFSTLPSTNLNTGISDEDITKLNRGDRKTAQIILENFLPKLTDLESVEPNRSFLEMQEVVKQCYALLGNVNIV